MNLLIILKSFALVSVQSKKDGTLYVILCCQIY